MGAVAMQGEHSKLDDFLRRYFARIVTAILFGFVATWLVTEIFFDTVVTHWYARIHKVVGDGDAAARLLTIILTFWGGLAVTGMWVWRNVITSRQATAAQLQAQVANQQAETARKQAEVALNTQISTDLAKAYEQLGNGSMAVRVGAIYTLEKVMRDVQDTDFNLYWSIIETLSGFARERSRDFPTAKTLKDASAEEAEALLAGVGSNLDLSCVLTVIGRRRIDERDKPIDLKGVFALRFSVPDKALNFDNCDLSAAVLAGAKLDGYHFKSSILRDAYLRGAILRSAELSGSNLSEADLGSAYLYQAVLKGAYIPRANLDRAILSSADLSDSFLHLSNLSRANLRAANLSGTDLSQTNLREANLREANLSDADLSGATLFNASNLTGDQIDRAYGDESTVLPDGQEPPARWSKHEDSQDKD